MFVVTNTLNAQVFIVCHGDMFAMVSGNVQGEWMRRTVTEQYALECLCAKIQASV